MICALRSLAGEGWDAKDADGEGAADEDARSSCCHVRPLVRVEERVAAAESETEPLRIGRDGRPLERVTTVADSVRPRVLVGADAGASCCHVRFDAGAELCKVSAGMSQLSAPDSSAESWGGAASEGGECGACGGETWREERPRRRAEGDAVGLGRCGVCSAVGRHGRGQPGCSCLVISLSIIVIGPRTDGAGEAGTRATTYMRWQTREGPGLGSSTGRDEGRDRWQQARARTGER